MQEVNGQVKHTQKDLKNTLKGVDNILKNVYNIITVKERQPRKVESTRYLKPYLCELPRGFAIVKKMIQGLPI